MFNIRSFLIKLLSILLKYDCIGVRSYGLEKAVKKTMVETLKSYLSQRFLFILLANTEENL